MGEKFLISSDPARKYEAWGEFLDDGRLHVTEGQWVSDEDLATIRNARHYHQHMNTGHTSTQAHIKPLLILPDALKRNIMSNGDGTEVQPADPEYQKRLRRVANDGEFRDLKIYEGNV